MTVDYFAELGGRNRWPLSMTEIDEATTRYHFLIATDHKKDKDTGADALRAAWGKERLRVTVPESATALWQAIAAPTLDLSILPPYSFGISFTFTLAQPYISRDDKAFYIVDNPIVRDKVFGLPFVRPSSWKGNLAAALRQLVQREEDASWQRLFGKVNEANDEGQAGRLVFFPTFFTQTGLEIINPHNRKTRVGKNPILFESVPVGARGVFTLLYVPFDGVGKEERETAKQVAEDLALAVRGLRAMFTVYGFSAKRTSGFGLARETVSEGKFAVNVAESVSHTGKTAPLSDDAAEQLQADVASFLQRFGLNEFPHWTNAELEKSGWGSKRQSEYKRLRARHPDWDSSSGEWREPQQTTIAVEVKVPAPLLSRTFASFDELVGVTDQVAQQLTEGGAS